MLAAVATAFALTSSAFHAGGTIPRAYTCDGKDVSPPLRWSAPPPSTRSFTLTLVDLDAKGFLHWRATAIRARTRSLSVGSRVGRQGKNDFGHLGYGGPCPPRGSPPHRYRFTLEALDAKGRLLARTRLLGRYGR